MSKFQGFRTIIFNIVAVTVAWISTNYGIEISEEHHMAITTTIITIGNIALRFMTKTPIGKKEKIVKHDLTKIKHKHIKK